LKEYASYKVDEKYTDVVFNYTNGGLKAARVNHIEKAEIHAKERKYFATDSFEGYTGKDLEVLCQQVLYKNGYSCILVDEKVKDTNGNMITALDTLTNGMHTDIRSITEQGKNTIKNCISEKLRQLLLLCLTATKLQKHIVSATIPAKSLTEWSQKSPFRHPTIADAVRESPRFLRLKS